MRILYHHRTRGEDAQGIHIREMVTAFRKLGHQVEMVGIVTPEGAKRGNTIGARISKFAAKVPPLVYEFLEVLYNAYGIYVLSRKVREFKPALLYERYALYNLAGIAVSRLYHIPLILEVNAPIATEKQDHSKIAMPKIARAFEGWICSNSHKTIVVSNVLKRILIEHGVPPEKLAVIPNGINPEIFNPYVNGNVIREKYGLEQKVVVGFVGWFRKWHGLEDLLNGYVEHDMERKKIHLLLVGDGPAYKDLFEFCKSRGLLDRCVTLVGSVDRLSVPEYIAAFDLAMQPDVTDYASPIKIFEYMAMGKGIIAPKKENITEILGREYNAYFEPGNWNEMAQLILFHGASRARASELGKKSLERLTEMKFWWTENARRTLELI